MEQIALSSGSGSISHTRSIVGFSFENSTVPAGTQNFILLMAAPNSETGNWPLSKAGILQCENTRSGFSKGFVWTRTSSATRSRLPTSQPSGISPSSESTRREGKRSAMGLGRPGSRPSALARTGSKSTNHDLNSARAIVSSVSFVRRFSSTLLSSAPIICAMARCVVIGGQGTLMSSIRKRASFGWVDPTCERGDLRLTPLRLEKC